MGQTGRPETSVLNQLTPRNNTEEGRIPFNSGGSVRSREVAAAYFILCGICSALDFGILNEVTS